MVKEAKSNSVLFSNQLERLAEMLKERLFSPHSQPFEKRMVIVPSSFLKTYLLHRFATDPDLGVAAGMQILTLPRALYALLEGEDRSVPSEMELSLQLECEIRSLMAEQKNEQEEEKNLLLSQGSAKRLPLLCEVLSRIFLRYGTFGGEFLKEWLEKKGWQQLLWNRIFSSKNSLWTYPYQALSAKKEVPFQIHLFGFNFLPKISWHYFENLGCTTYILSPCEFFWTDLCTDRERISLHKKFKKEEEKEAFDLYLSHHHPFLANMGKLGRQWLKHIEEKDFETEERYIEGGRNTLLHAVQHDLLRLESAEGDTFPSEDRSFQLHAAPSAMREIEILLDTLYALFAANPDLKPQDILILAPDINDYVPYIHMVFGSSSCRLKYAISGLERAKQSCFAGAFFHLLLLPDSRFDLASVLKLFSYSPFLEKFEIAREEVALIRKWLEEANIYWGFDAEQRHLLVGQEIIETTDQGTWVHGLDRLLWGLASLTSQEEDFPSAVQPLSCVEFNEAELLGKLIQILRSLNEDLSILSQECGMTLSCWLKKLKALAEKYFTLLEEDRASLEEFDHYQTLFQAADPLFPFSSIQRLMEHFFKQKTGAFQRTDLQAVHFCSLHPGSALPSQVIYLLGMEESRFPRGEVKHSLCEMSHHVKRDYFPSKNDEDRYLFLELLPFYRHRGIFKHLWHQTDPSSRISEENEFFVHPRNLSHPCFLPP